MGSQVIIYEQIPRILSLRPSVTLWSSMDIYGAPAARSPSGSRLTST